MRRHGPRLCSAPLRGRAASGARERSLRRQQVALRHALVGWVERSETHRASSLRKHDGFRCALPILQSRRHTPSHPRGAICPSFAWSLRPQIQEGAGKAGCRLAPAVRCAKGSAKEPHSSIQVKPNTRPSLRDGRTAYAVLSREPNSFWPPSLSRNSPAPRRLTRSPHPQELGRSNDGQDHTVLPYARPAISLAVLPALSTKPEAYKRDEPVSAVRPRDVLGSRRAIRPAPAIRARRYRVHRKPGSRQ